MKRGGGALARHQHQLDKATQRGCAQPNDQTAVWTPSLQVVVSWEQSRNAESYTHERATDAIKLHPKAKGTKVRLR